jgi:hypothetical protein
MPCESKVRIWYDEKNKPAKYELICEGKCDDETGKPPCAQQEVGKPPTLKFCGCKDDFEPKGCQIYLKIAGGVTTAECSTSKCLKKDGNVDPNKKCVPRRLPLLGKSELPIPDKDGKYRGKLGRSIVWECSCVPKDDPEPEDPNNPDPKK